MVHDNGKARGRRRKSMFRTAASGRKKRGRPALLSDRDGWGVTAEALFQDVLRTLSRKGVAVTRRSVAAVLWDRNVQLAQKAVQWRVKALKEGEATYKSIDHIAFDNVGAGLDK